MSQLSRKEFAEALRGQLALGFEPVRIARWAYELHLSTRAFAPELERDILQLVAMDMGEEFEMTEKDLHDLAYRET